MKKKFISTNMKIFILVLFILSIAFYTSGCIALVHSGYKLSDYADELHINPDTFKYNSIFDKLNFDFNTSYLSKDYAINDSINEIDFNLNSQDIKVTNYDGENLKIQIKSNNSITSDLLQAENDNKLILNTRYDTPDNASISVSIPYKFKDKCILRIITSSGDISVSNLAMNTLNLSSGSGDIDILGSTIDYLSLNDSSGNINFNNITTSTETKLDTSSGNIIGSGTLGTVNATTSSGDIDLQFINSLNNISLNTHSGSINLSIPKNLGYKINYETSSGYLNSPNNQLSFGDENALINVNTVSGDLNVH